MDKRTKARFIRLWQTGVPLAEIAEKLNYSISTLAKLRMLYGLRKRYGAEPEGGDPTPEQIRERAAECREDWDEHDFRLRWQGDPGQLYASENLDADEQ